MTAGIDLLNLEREQEKLVRPNVENKEALFQLQQINMRLEGDDAHSIHDLSNIQKQIVLQLSCLDLNEKAHQLSEELLALFNQDAFHHPETVDLENGEALLDQLEEELGADHVLVKTFANFGGAFAKAREEEKKDGNLGLEIANIGQRYGTKMQKTIESCYERVNGTQGSINDLQISLDELRSKRLEKDGFGFDEASSELARIKKVLTLLPEESSPYALEQAKKLQEFIDECDFSKKPDEATVDKLIKNLERMQDGLRQELPRVTREIERETQYHKLAIDMLKECLRSYLHLLRTLTANQRV